MKLTKKAQEIVKLIEKRIEHYKTAERMEVQIIKLRMDMKEEMKALRAIDVMIKEAYNSKRK